ncbi:MAG: hypothetical protein KatS3mg035_0971 [Bacteroidia bacterium]|nr:MAG: hypothetical protein KatS3mg035_0971 [Bacteroidia bacterium]
MMNYKKIIELSIRCEKLEAQIFEYYRFIGANNPPTEIADQIRSCIQDIKIDIQKLHNQIRKEVK